MTPAPEDTTTAARGVARQMEREATKERETTSDETVERNRDSGDGDAAITGDGSDDLTAIRGPASRPRAAAAWKAGRLTTVERQ